MRLTTRALNRTLWVRQHLVPGHPPAGRELTDPLELITHLIGLQAQDNRPPYLSLAARLPAFDPHTVSDALGDRRVVRLLAMRGTVHVLTPPDALALRPWVQPALDRQSRTNQQSRPARDVPSDALTEAVTAELADGPLPVAELGARLLRRFPSATESALRNAARERVALVQVPPRGQWNRSGGVVYQLATTWLGAPLREPDPAEFVRRYLRAFGPASAADMTRWSLVTGLAAVFRSLGDELVQHTDEAGRTLYDVADGVIADPDLELPAVAFGTYDNIWLSHADRTRICDDDKRRRWMGVNGGNGDAVFVDGRLEGQWRSTETGVEFTAYRRLTRAERAAVDAALMRAAAFLRG